MSRDATWAAAVDRDAAMRTNRGVYDAMAAADDPLCRVVSDAELVDPLRTVDAAGWLGRSIAGKSVLCLAAGGGRQSSLYAAAGADVTVVDLSPAMLELDRRAAVHRGHHIRLLETSMDDLHGLRDAEFDIVIHPVSTCYLPSVRTVFAEVARVLRGGGLYISQHKTPVNLQASTRRGRGGHYEITHGYYDRSPVAPVASTTAASQRLRETGASEFVHRWEELIGGMCRSGFVIEDLIEPDHTQVQAAIDTFADRAAQIAPYVRIKARRVATDTRLWLP